MTDPITEGQRPCVECKPSNLDKLQTMLAGLTASLHSDADTQFVGELYFAIKELRKEHEEAERLLERERTFIRFALGELSRLKRIEESGRKFVTVFLEDQTGRNPATTEAFEAFESTLNKEDTL